MSEEPFVILSDREWQIIEPQLPPAKFGGRPRTTNLRQAFNSILYVLKTGCHWRALAHTNFGVPWETCYGYFIKWRRSGALRRINNCLVKLVRKKAGRRVRSTIAIVDSQSVKTGKLGGVRGFDGGKKVKGRKRHLLVDSLGLLLSVSVTSANTHDTTGGRKVITRFMRKRTRFANKLYADKGYQGNPFASWVRKKTGSRVIIGKRLFENGLNF